MTDNRSTHIKRKKRTFSALPPGHISVLLRSNSGLVPLSNIAYSIKVGPGRVLKGTTDSDGFIQHPGIPIGYYVMKMEGLEHTTLVPAMPTEIDRHELRVAGYMLFPVGSTEDEEELGFWYTIQKGDSLSKIARRFGVPGGWRKMWEHEDNTEFRSTHDDYNLIFPGEEIWVPGVPDDSTDD